MNYENIPKQLQDLKQWVCAKADSKAPMRAWEAKAASSTDYTTWSDFKTALEAYNLWYYDYCGFVFADNGLVGIDIDCGFDEDGFVSPLAADIIGKCKSYTEKSRSGRGFHIILKGELPFKGKNNLKGVEIYKSARYFIMTGDTLIYKDIAENQEAIDYVVETYFPEVRESNGKSGGNVIYSPKWDYAVNGSKITIRPNYPEITNGSRNLSLTSLAGALHNQGYTKTQILNELTYVNSVACKPPLDGYELQSICNSITKYKR